MVESLWMDMLSTTEENIMSKQKVIIYGNTQTAELAHYYLSHDSDHDVYGFSLESDYIKSDTFQDLPIFPFEDLKKSHPPEDFALFAPITAIGMNELRMRIYNDGKRMGYSFINYISSRSTILTDQIGENNFILEDNTIQPRVKIGNNSIFWSGNHIGHHSTIHDHCFFTSHVVLSGNCVVNKRCFFGVNSTIRDYCELGEGTLLGMGASLTKKKTEAWSVYTGSPATKNLKRSSLDLM